MKYLLIMFFVTSFFETQVLKTYNIENQYLSNLGILVGWFLQEYVKETYNLTGGKFFITNSELKNKIILKIITFCYNFIDTIYLLTLFEISFYLSSIYLILNIYNSQYQNAKYSEIFKLWGIITCIYAINNTLDFYFLLKPLVIFSFYLIITIEIIVIFYIFYVLILKIKTLKNLCFVIKTLMLKILFITLFLFLLINMLFDSYCTNFLKETYFKFLILFITIEKCRL